MAICAGQSVLGPVGAAFWASATASRSFDAAAELLLLEACRLADRLDRLNEHLEGRDGWFEAIYTDDGGTVEVSVDKALAEARQNALALRQIVTSLGLGKVEETRTGRSRLDDLSARRASRRTGSAG